VILNDVSSSTAAGVQYPKSINFVNHLLIYISQRKASEKQGTLGKVKALENLMMMFSRMALQAKRRRVTNKSHLASSRSPFALQNANKQGILLKGL
jgi:hypothetical protein